MNGRFTAPRGVSQHGGVGQHPVAQVAQYGALQIHHSRQNIPQLLGEFARGAREVIRAVLSRRCDLVEGKLKVRELLRYVGRERRVIQPRRRIPSAEKKTK